MVLTNNEYYNCYCQSNPEGTCPLLFNFDVSSLTDYEFSFDAMITNITYNNQLYVQFKGYFNSLSPIDNHILGYGISKANSTGRWWHIEITRIGDTITEKVYDDSNTLVHTSNPSVQSTTDNGFQLGAWGGQANKYIKNIRIKSL